MQKISAWTDLASPTGAYRYGSLVGGVAPTPIKAEWLNMMQDELCNFVLAYLPALNKDDNTQVLKAAQKMVANFAVRATTLAGYGILDAYTKPQTDSMLARKADWAITLGGYGITDAYTKVEVNASLQAIRDEVTNALALKQDKNTASLDANGWHLDSATGRIEVWGQVSLNVDNALGSQAVAAVVFARPFPTKVLNVSFSVIADGGDLTEALENSVAFGSITNSGMNVIARRLFGSNDGTQLTVVQYRVVGH
ncbi:phage tail protein [Pseudomonas asiatica]|uniref:phage tail protein n=1 Tax=Pseudomonas asiatica TaxID=2219225 RepID=UPI0018A96FEA|nr:phage tail protein [Pseudomonas asiatica]MBF8802206.1 phage tail protein [Pseudomonas asiatica]